MNETGRMFPDGLDTFNLTKEAKARFPLVYSFDEIDDTIVSQIGGKAANLIALRNAGLPVPMGFCVTTDAHNYYLENGTLPPGLVDDITKIKALLGGKVAIRSSANCEDGTDLSMAGVFQSHYVYADEHIGRAVEHIYIQSRTPEVAQFMALHGKSHTDVKMGLVVQELIEPQYAGVIYTGVNGDNILVQYVDGLGARLVDGETQGSAVLLDRNGAIAESTGYETRPLSTDVISQLADHTTTIENLFADVPQDIEFAYHDSIISILQARPMTADLGRVDLTETPGDCLEATKEKIRKLTTKEKRELGTDTVIFSDANYSELLPRPTEMDIGIYMYVWGGTDTAPGAKQLGHAAMGYQTGDTPIEIISYLGGRTYSSIGRYAAIYHVGFPETREEYFSTLVKEYLDTVQQDPQKGAYPQMGLFLQDPTLKDLQLRYGARAGEYFQIYQTFSARMAGFADEFITQFYSSQTETNNFIKAKQAVDLDQMTDTELLGHGTEILEHIRTSSYLDFVKAARLGFYYSQRLQDLLRQRVGVGSEQAKEIYSRLNQGLQGSAITDANIAIARAPSESEALQIAQLLIGHLSTGEMLEIRHQLLRDTPDSLAAYVRGIRHTGQYVEQFERQREARLQAQQALLSSLPEGERDEFARVIRSSQIYMALRETAKYLFTKEYLLVKDTLELLNRRLGLEKGDIYFVYPRELPRLVADPQSMRHLIRSRQQSFANYQQLDMPNVIREADIDNLQLKTEKNETFTEAFGKFLADGSKEEGVVVNIDEFTSLDDINKAITHYLNQDIRVILVATQMNLSHDPFIAQASGLVIENAGIVAHGAQRARELGKGAIGGIKSRQLKTGTRVSFDPAGRSVKKIN